MGLTVPKCRPNSGILFVPDPIIDRHVFTTVTFSSRLYCVKDQLIAGCLA